jgi:hypothetical protein
MSTEKKCTMKDLDFHMNYHESCTSCENGECHGTGYSTDKEHFIHVLAITSNGPFIVTIHNCNNNEPPETKHFPSDSECATHLRDFFNFRCT